MGDDIFFVQTETTGNNLGNDIMKALETTECISKCLDGIKIFPMVGTCSTLLNKSKYQGFFDGIFVSSRYAQILGEEYFGGLLNPTSKSFVAAETAKFVVPLNSDIHHDFLAKQEEFAKGFRYTKAQGMLHYSLSCNVFRY